MSIEKHPFGWRRRIGMISPTVIEVAAYDFYRVAPPGVGLCGVTSNIEFWDKGNFERSLASVLDAASYLASRHVDFIIHAGMPLVTTRGKGFEDELVQQIVERTKLPATTSIRAAIRALRHLGARKLALLSPYPSELHNSAITFLTKSEFEVVVHHSMNVDFKRLQEVTPEQIYGAAKRLIASAPSVDGVYIPCAQWEAPDATPLIEADFGIPVVTGGQADIWEAFQTVGIRDLIEGHGQLMRSLSQNTKDMPPRTA